MAKHNKHRKTRQGLGAKILFGVAATLLVVALVHDALIGPVRG
jgi:hypothetical protein